MWRQKLFGCTIKGPLTEIQRWIFKIWQLCFDVFSIYRRFYFASLPSVFDNKKLQKKIYVKSTTKSKTKNMMSAMRQKIKMLEQIPSNTHIPLSKIRCFVVFKNVELYKNWRRENRFLLCKNDINWMTDRRK